MSYQGFLGICLLVKMLDVKCVFRCLKVVEMQVVVNYGKWYQVCLGVRNQEDFWVFVFFVFSVMSKFFF